MSRSTHAPGPWKTETLGQTIRVVDSRGNDVAVVGEVSDANAADAILVAAAPDMEAEIAQLRGAIQKALRELRRGQAGCARFILERTPEFGKDIDK